MASCYEARVPLSKVVDVSFQALAMPSSLSFISIPRSRSVKFVSEEMVSKSVSKLVWYVCAVVRIFRASPQAALMVLPYPGLLDNSQGDSPRPLP
jgi:hypothetical protein